MIEFIIGFIVGIMIAILVFTILTFFRTGIEKKIKIIETQIVSKQKPKGMIIMPDDEVELTRQEIIKKNKEAGKDTPISDLM
jgi:hypothetical protein